MCIKANALVIIAIMLLMLEADRISFSFAHFFYFSAFYFSAEKDAHIFGVFYFSV